MPTSLQTPSEDQQSFVTLTPPLAFSLDGEEYLLSLAEDEGITDLFSSVDLDQLPLDMPLWTAVLEISIILEAVALFYRKQDITGYNKKKTKCWFECEFLYLHLSILDDVTRIYWCSGMWRRLLPKSVTLEWSWNICIFRKTKWDLLMTSLLSLGLGLMCMLLDKTLCFRPLISYISVCPSLKSELHCLNTELILDH